MGVADLVVMCDCQTLFHFYPATLLCKCTLHETIDKCIFLQAAFIMFEEWWCVMMRQTVADYKHRSLVKLRMSCENQSINNDLCKYRHSTTDIFRCSKKEYILVILPHIKLWSSHHSLLLMNDEFPCMWVANICLNLCTPMSSSSTSNKSTKFKEGCTSPCNLLVIYHRDSPFSFSCAGLQRSMVDKSNIVTSF